MGLFSWILPVSLRTLLFIPPAFFSYHWYLLSRLLRIQTGIFFFSYSLAKLLQVSQWTKHVPVYVWGLCWRAAAENCISVHSCYGQLWLSCKAKTKKPQVFCPKTLGRSVRFWHSSGSAVLAYQPKSPIPCVCNTSLPCQVWCSVTSAWLFAVQCVCELV